MKRYSGIFLLMIMSGGFSLIAGGQEPEGLVKYTPDFRFTDGIYLNFDQVRTNKPIPKAKILTSTDYNDKEFFKNLFAGEKIYYYDALGIRQEIEKNSVWGFARNGILYIQIQGNFNRITFVGNICHFVADITSYDSRYYSPYGYYDPYYSPYYSPSYYPYYYSPYYSNYYSPYGSYYSPYRNNIARNEMKQYLIDFENGKILEYDVDNAEMLLMKDSELYEEYMRLPRKKRKELIFVYIRKFNEKNPLYLPAG
ncbi:MAG: hypothetical protein RBR81_00495 [Bacteroidales bacterium]|nr:hypothetical protein [Bacteroidales bacterium]